MVVLSVIFQKGKPFTSFPLCDEVKRRQRCFYLISSLSLRQNQKRFWCACMDVM